MRRFDRTYLNFSSSNDDEQRLALPREDNWMKSTMDHLATTQNKLRINVTQNSDNILLCRQESVAVAENLRSAVNMWQQFGEKLSRITDQMEFDRNSFVSIMCISWLFMSNTSLGNIYLGKWVIGSFYLKP